MVRQPALLLNTRWEVNTATMVLLLCAFQKGGGWDPGSVAGSTLKLLLLSAAGVKVTLPSYKICHAL